MRGIEYDGIDHINIYSKGETELGRALSNFAHTPIDFPPYGHFESLEGLWYWLLTKDDRLRDMYGFSAKELGRRLSQTKCDNQQEIIELAMEAKVEQHSWIAEMMRQNDLPYDHYYVFNGKPKDAGFKWVVRKWEQIAKALKQQV